MILIKPVQSNELNVVIDLAKQIWPVCYAHILTLRDLVFSKKLGNFKNVI